MTISHIPRVLGPAAQTSQQTLASLLAVGDLLDHYRPNLERRFMLDLILDCPLTTEDVLALGLQLLHEAAGLSELHAARSTLRRGLRQLSPVPVRALQA